MWFCGGPIFPVVQRECCAWHMVGRQGIGKVHRSPRQSRAGKVARERWGWPWVPSSTGSWPTGLCQPRPLPQQSHWWLVSTSLDVSEATIPCPIRGKNQPQECPCQEHNSPTDCTQQSLKISVWALPQASEVRASEVSVALALRKSLG